MALESDYVINQNVKRFLRKNSQSNDDDTESTDYNSEDENAGLKITVGYRIISDPF